MVVEQLQLSGLQALLPLVLSPDDRKAEKAVAMTLKIDLPLSDACSSDSLGSTLCMRQCSDMIRRLCNRLERPTYVPDFCRDVMCIVDALAQAAPAVELAIDLPGSNSLTKDVCYRAERTAAGLAETLIVDSIQACAFLGCSDAERAQPQTVVLRAELAYRRTCRGHVPRINTQSLVVSIVKYVEAASCCTMEHLASTVVDFIETRYCFARVEVFLQKPHAIKGASSSGVRIGRATPHLLLNSRCLAAGSHANTAYLSLGSNAEDGLTSIHRALALLKADPHTAIADSSFLYRSQYEGALPVKRPDFLNVAVKVHTSHSPGQLLAMAKGMEDSLGRVKQPGCDDRAIDVDIVLYNNDVVESSMLTLPHARMHLREWVLRPLADIDPFFIHPLLGLSVTHLLEDVLRRLDCRVPMGLGPEDMPCTGVERVIRLGGMLHRWDAGERPLVMGVLNATPDSFSDGGLHQDADAARARALEMVAQGVDIIDVGGASTRPGADDVSEDVERSRVVPVVDALSSAAGVALSVDTTSPAVARECLRRGVSLVNTTLQTQHTQEMYRLAADTDSPIVLMHSRGTSKTMASLASGLRGSDLLQSIGRETAAMVEDAKRQGVYRWNIIVDPGVGFAKTAAQSLDIISGFHRHRPFSSYPCLVGHSRKSFVQGLGLAADAGGHCSHHAALWGTLAATSVLCHGKTFIVRVHDVLENATVAKLHGLLGSGGRQGRVPSAGTARIQDKETR